MEVIVVLGSPNFPDGSLGPIAIDRLNACLSVFIPSQHKILCTGGFGAHFNTSPIAHSVYLKNYLLDHSVPVDSFLPAALSSNTVEDAFMSLSILKNESYTDVLILSSEYHLARVEYIFKRILKDFNLKFKAVAHQSMDNLLSPLIQHEKIALEQLKSNGLYY
jgi:uncharacterized SAM-binding protein YcdF (DUF218 family)